MAALWPKFSSFCCPPGFLSFFLLCFVFCLFAFVFYLPPSSFEGSAAARGYLRYRLVGKYRLETIRKSSNRILGSPRRPAGLKKIWILL